jgi:hypothetical protein
MHGTAFQNAQPRSSVGLARGIDTPFDRLGKDDVLRLSFLRERLI